MTNSFLGEANVFAENAGVAQRETCLHLRGLPYWMPPHGEFFP
jgi:hypothetical protein